MECMLTTVRIIDDSSHSFRYPTTLYRKAMGREFGTESDAIHEMVSSIKPHYCPAGISLTSKDRMVGVPQPSPVTV